mmetsp:Transcript_4048/g.9025  ORF Transcript_4048/g.9025 Transcript_4048/m.9025 type:complete len:303 (+) Transcript_4048:664-1572(+)
MSIHIHQILILALRINGRKVMFSRIETEIVGSQKGHGSVGDLFVAHVPSDDGGVEEGDVSSLFGIVFPNVAEVGYHESLVVVDAGSSSGGGSAKKRRRNPLVIPSPLELPKILLRKQIPRLPIEHRIPVLILPVHKRPRKDQPARRLPILRRRPGHVRKPVRLRGIKRNDGGIGLEGMSLVQIHVLVGVPIVLIENESVRFDGHPSPGNVDFQLGIISLVQEEFAIGKSSFPARLAQHVPQGRQELISPKLDFVPIFRPAQLVADDVAVGPPFRFVRLHFLVAVESVFLGVVGVEGPVSLQV